LANTRQTEAQNTGLDIQNQMAQQNLDLYKQMLKPQTAAATPTASPVSGVTPINTPDIPGYYQNKYRVNPTMTPQEVQDISNAKFLDSKMGTNFSAGKMLNYENRVKQLQFKSQTGSQQDYDKLVNGVVNANASGDSAYTNLKQINPGLADQVARKAGLDPTNQDSWNADQKKSADQTAVSVAGQHAAVIHQYTGSDYKTEGGTQYDARTNTTPPGPARQVLSPEQASARQLKLAEPVDSGAPARPSLSSFSGIGDKPASGGATRAPTTPPPKSPNTVGGQPLEPEYKLPPDFSNTVAQTPEQQHAGNVIIDSKKSLLDDNAVLTSSSQQGLTYTKAAQDLMASHGNVTGLGAGAKANISRALQAAGITEGVDATNYQILAKQLGNIAVQNFKTNFGARPAAKEFDIQMNTLNPNEEMTPTAINNLLDFNSKNFNYSLATGHRAAEYDTKGGNPLKFYDWNNTHFPQSKIVNAPAHPGQETSGFVVGKAYKDKSGNTATYRGNGKWE
jgi:hypothetical protein